MRTLDLPEIVTTPRLVLRRGRATDGPALGDALAASLDALAPWFRWAASLQRWGDAEDLACRAVIAEERYAAGEDPTYFLWGRDRPDRLLGEVVLRSEGWDYGVLALTVWVRPDTSGRGLASEASRTLIHEAFRARTRFVEAEVDSRNAPSRRLVTRLGFERYGFARDAERYVLAA